MEDMNNKKMLEEGDLLNLQFEKRGGLLPVVVQESSTGQVLMLAYVNEEAFRLSMQCRKACFFSTSRNKLWVKGATSGNYLQVDKVLVDCDQDALVFRVTLTGSGVCHTLDQYGNHRKACFYRDVSFGNNQITFLEGTK